MAIPRGHDDSFERVCAATRSRRHHIPWTDRALVTWHQCAKCAFGPALAGPNALLDPLDGGLPAAGRLAPPRTLADFPHAQRRLAHRPGAGAQVVQVLLDPEQVRVRQLIRGRDDLWRARPVPAQFVPGHRRAHHGGQWH